MSDGAGDVRHYPRTGGPDQAGPVRSAPALDIAGLTVRYGDTLAVDDVGLVIPTGQTVALGTRGLGGALALLPRVPDRRPGRHSAACAGAE